MEIFVTWISGSHVTKFDVTKLCDMWQEICVIFRIAPVLSFRFSMLFWNPICMADHCSNSRSCIRVTILWLLEWKSMLNSSFNTKLSQTSDYSTTNMTYISQQSGQLLQPVTMLQHQQHKQTTEKTKSCTSASSSTASGTSLTNTTTTGLIMKQINENINNYIKYDCPTTMATSTNNNKKASLKQQQQFIDAYDFTNSTELLSYPLYASSSTTSSTTSH